VLIWEINVRRRKTGKEKRTGKGNPWWNVEKKMKGIED